MKEYTLRKGESMAGINSVAEMPVYNLDVVAIDSDNLNVRPDNHCHYAPVFQVKCPLPAPNMKTKINTSEATVNSKLHV
jgi:hypothetical protein